MATEAIGLYLESLKADGEPIPVETRCRNRRGGGRRARSLRPRHAPTAHCTADDGTTATQGGGRRLVEETEPVT